MDNDYVFLNTLNIIEGIGSQKIKMLLDYFGSAEAVWQASEKELIKSQISENLAAKITSQRHKINPEEEWKKMQKAGIQMITIKDKNYPRLLKEIPNPPYTLYIRTNDKDFDWNLSPMIAVVGSRKFTQYGKQAAEKLSHDLARAGIIIVSGMAIGIDSFAHHSALEAGGKTVAVLGSSLEDSLIGPRANFNLSRDILNAGVLVSDYPLGVSSAPGNFPARNRIMAGLSLGTLVVEAALDSGSLITASLALEFNREVFAVPGSIFSPQSEGCHKLIKDGAKIVTGVASILEELNLEKRAVIEQARKVLPTTKEEEIIAKNLSHEPTNIDRIIKLTKLEASVVSATLSIMEMKGLVKNIGGQNYIII